MTFLNALFLFGRKIKCQHGYMFDANNENSVVELSNIIVFGTVEEQVFEALS